MIADRAAQRIASATAVVKDLGVLALGIPTDVSRDDGSSGWSSRTVEGFGKIDILVNNAGTLLVKPMIEQSKEGWNACSMSTLGGLSLLSPCAARDDCAMAGYLLM